MHILLRATGDANMMRDMLVDAVLIVFTQVLVLVAMIIAVRQALDYQSTGRAVGVCLIGWIICVVILVWSLLLFSGGNSQG